jgi:hypothetical protein
VSAIYSFVCNRCNTTASDTSRWGIELFTSHHMATVHKGFDAEHSAEIRALRPVRKRRRRSASLSLVPA